MRKCLLYRSLLLIFIILLCVACKKREDDTIVLAVESDFMQYEDENIQAYTVDEEGSLYIVGMAKTNCNHGTDAASAVEHSKCLNTIYLYKYDLEGNMVFSHDFDDSIFLIDGIAVNENKIFLTVPSSNDQGTCLSLYVYHMDTDIMEHLYDFNAFEYAKQIIYLENRIYILGQNHFMRLGDSNDFKGAYKSKGEKLVYYSFEDNKGYDIGVNIPISMSPCDDGTLLINSYLDNEGYCLLKYDSKIDSIKVVASFDTGLFQYFASCGNGNKLIYISHMNLRGLVISDIKSTEVEAEIYSDATTFNFGIYHVKGQVYCMTKSRAIVRITLDKYCKENPVIKYISPENQVGEPFGCGYSMKRSELEEDKFALKLLSQDKDYDLCFMNTSSSFSYNIRKNGVFYPLNNVEGIGAYLDSCFPYVKEVAINENGDIWMLPIGVDIPGLVVNKEVVAKENIGLKNNMTYEEFYQVQDKMTQELYQKADCSPFLLYQSFFAQFFNKQTGLDYNLLRSKMKLFHKYDSRLPYGNSFYPDDEFLYDYCKSAFFYEVTLNLTTQERNLEVYAMPKLNATDKNIGTCSFLAVNPNSKNLKETLAYLADLISYTMEQDKIPLHFKQPVKEEGTLRQSIYDLYKNGEITFYMDRDVYVDGFFDVVENGADIEEYIKETKRKLDKYLNE